jgi:hypothetical protein
LIGSFWLISVFAEHSPVKNFFSIEESIEMFFVRNSEIELRKIFDERSLLQGIQTYLKKEHIPEVLRDLQVHLSTEEIDERLNSFDSIESSGLSWDDFKKIVNQPSVVEQWTASIPFSRLIASAIPANSLDQLDHIDENEALRDLCQALLPGTERLLREHIQGFKKARALMIKSKNKTSNISSKFSLLNCGTIDDFHGGLEKRIGSVLPSSIHGIS